MGGRSYTSSGDKPRERSVEEEVIIDDIDLSETVQSYAPSEPDVVRAMYFERIVRAISVLSPERILVGAGWVACGLCFIWQVVRF